ncbi:P3a [Torilis crimson leaf virus]|uniref:P3a n=1 Tax=Torilis crimson leaf virus TaxID=1862685 RepID=A0A6H2MW80_9VIRU|nr:P3a [Torilis crimson leaf virus]
MTLISFPNSSCGWFPVPPQNNSWKRTKLAEKTLLQSSEVLDNYRRAIIDYKFLAGIATGFILAVPICVIGLYYVYLLISSNIRSIVNEYGRG